MTTAFAIGTLVVAPAATFILGIWILARAGQQWRAVGLWCTYAPVTILLLASWLTAYTIGVVLLPATIVLLVVAAATTRITRNRWPAAR